MLRYGIPFHVLESDQVPEFLENHGVETLDELYVRLGEGKSRLKIVMEDIRDSLYGGVSPLVTPTGAFNKIELTTLDPVCVKLSSCCKPDPTAKDNCALLTPVGLSVHHKNCENLKDLQFQREDAVDIFWRRRKTNVRKRQYIHILRATRIDVMNLVATSPEEVEIQKIALLSSYSSQYPAWELHFKVPNLYLLQKLIKHLDKSELPYEFELEL